MKTIELTDKEIRCIKEGLHYSKKLNQKLGKSVEDIEKLYEKFKELQKK